MRGLTHVFIGIGFVSLLLILFKTPFILWGVGSFLISPIFSRLPDYDQKIADITFNQIVPHRGKGTHNLLYSVPLILLVFIQDLPIIGSLLVMLVGSIFGAIFIHAFVDAFNYGGVWIGFLKTKGFLRWDSFWGNLFFKIIGILLFLLSLLCYLDNPYMEIIYT
ncbi:MAG: hypothetical protein ACFFFH_12470 [Candidatus Thorarchaeota archaeon]